MSLVTDGLTPAFNGFVTARIEAIAAAVGAPHEWAAQCRPNVGIYFTDAPQKMLDEVVKHAPQLLGFHYPHQARSRSRRPSMRPIQAWYVLPRFAASMRARMWSIAFGGKCPPAG